MTNKNFSKLLASLAFSFVTFGNVNPASALTLEVEMNENLERQLLINAVQTDILGKFYHQIAKNPTQRDKELMKKICDETENWEILHTLQTEPWGNYIPEALITLRDQIENGEKQNLVELMEREKNDLCNIM